MTHPTSKDSADRELIRKFQAGDQRAFERLVVQRETDMLNLAYRLTGNADDAADIRQLAFLRAYIGLGSFNGNARFDTWMYRVVVNLCRDHLRSKQLKLRLTDSITDQTYETDPDQCDTESIRADAARRVAQALAALPEAEREVVVLRHYHDLPFPAIAEVLHAPVTTIKSRMARGLQHLHETLRDYEQD